MISLFLPLLLLAAGQKTSDKLPPANPLPPPVTEEGQVMMPVNAVLKGIETSDGAAIIAASRPEGSLTAVFDAGGKRVVNRISWADFAASLKSGGDHYEERLFDPAIEIEGDVAFVWARFTVLKNGAPHHCGYDLFDLVRENGSWKVLNVTWSQHTDGCTAE